MMYRTAAFILLASASSPALTADQLKYAPAPAWAVQRAVPTSANAPADAPVAILLMDEQISFQRGKTTSYVQTALKIQTSQGLSAGNISFAWNPATDTVTVHKLHIRRGSKVIDVLANGQTFTTVRQEPNLEAAMLDGRLTANIQPEGLQEGDIIELATSVEHVDPVFQGHVQTVFANWNGAPVKAARARLIWPSDIKLNVRQSDTLPAARPVEKGGMKTLELALDDVQPLVPPKGAPLRYSLGRLAEASDFTSWGQAADLMIPLYRQASVIPASGPLRSEVERIRTQTADPRKRAELALALVQDRVRYVALLMGAGGYVPASAELTWSRRFGDCKGKTALLLGVLRELGIEAEPVLVNSRAGDALTGRLPMLALFDHVLVRARIGGATYWLDGTRTGDVALDEIPVPNVRWALPLVTNADLVPVAPVPLAKPEMETLVQVDATAGIFAAVPFKVERVIRGDAAQKINVALASLPAAQLDHALREYWKGSYDFVTVKAARFAHAKSELRLTMDGQAKLEWKDGWLYVPDSTIAYEPDFERAAGPNRDAPWTVNHPAYERARVTIRLPDGFAPAEARLPAPVKEVLGGVEYSRAVSLKDNVLTLEKSERTLRPEVPYKQALAAAPRLKAIYDEDVYLRVPAAYRATAQDEQASAADKPASASAFIARGALYLTRGKLDEGIADFSEAMALEPNNVRALANRALAHAYKRDPKAAEKDLARADAIDRDDPFSARVRGYVAQSRGDHRAAVDAYSKSLGKEPGDAFALSQRAVAYRALGDNAKALADTDELIAAGRKDPELRLMRANIFDTLGNRDGAIREAELAVIENPESDYALVAAGKIYAEFGLHERAVQTIDRALAIKQDPYIYVNRAQARAPSDEAGRMADLDTALKLDPNEESALLVKGGMLATYGRYAEAVTVYDRALAQAKDERPYFAVYRAVALYKAGRTSEAEKAFSSMRSKTKEAGELNNLCWTKATAGILLESALEDCRAALKMEPEKSAYLDSLGMVFLRLGRFDEAIAAYDKAIAKRPLAASLMGRAIAYARKGDVARSEADAAEARKLEPRIEERFAEWRLTTGAAKKLAGD